MSLLVLQLYLLWAWYDLFVYYFWYDSSGLLMALSYKACVYILHDHPGFLSWLKRGSPYRDFAEIGRKPHSHNLQSSRYPFKYRTMPLRCQCGLPTIISRAYNHFRAQMII